MSSLSLSKRLSFATICMTKNDYLCTMGTKIKYSSKKTVSEMATDAGVSEAAVWRYIRIRGIDRKYEQQLLLFNKVQRYLRHHKDASVRQIAEDLDICINTARKYAKPENKPQKQLNGKISTIGKRENAATLLTVSEKEDVILNSILHLYLNDAETFDCDLTFGNGGFYKYISRPKACFDKYPKFEDVLDLDLLNTELPLYNSVVCDLPHYIDVKSKETPERFASLKDAYHHHSRMIKIAHNILKPNGILVYKTTDFVVDGRQEWISDYAIKEARAAGFDLIDKFIYIVPKRMMRRHSNQGFATKNHAFFFVFRKTDSNDSK